MSKKIVASLVCMTMVIASFIGCGKQQETEQQIENKEVSKEEKAESIKSTEEKEVKGKSGTISVMGNTNEIEAIKAAMKEYNKQNPDVKLETIIVTDTTAFETVMTAKIASNDLPDLICMQVNSLIGDYAKNGYVQPIESLHVQDHLIDGDMSLLKYDDKLYAIPMGFQASGFYVNNEVLKKYGVKMEEPPHTTEEFLGLCDKLQKAGLDRPIVIGAKDSSPATAFVFTYLYQHVYGANPNWYADVLRGKDAWNGELFKGTFDTYAKLLPYTNKDLLGVDKNGAVKKFVIGEAAIVMDYVSLLKDIRSITPDLDITFCPPSFVEKAEDQTAITSFDNAVLISANVKNKDLVEDFYKFLFSGEAYNQACIKGAILPAIKEANVPVDPALNYLTKQLSQGMKTCAMLSRQWIPGIKEVMKKGAQDFLAGKDANTIADNIEAEHKRLVEGNPDYVKNFLANYVDIK